MYNIFIYQQVPYMVPQYPCSDCYLVGMKLGLAGSNNRFVELHAHATVTARTDKKFVVPCFCSAAS